MSFSFVDIDGLRYLRDCIPSECSICHFSVQPREETWTLAPSPEGDKRILEAVFRCPRPECSHFFIARYQRSDIITTVSSGGIGSKHGEFTFLEAVPSTPPSAHVPAEIAAMSPSFPVIYSQALSADSYGLDQVAGVGYRKALEFLIKDFCIAQNPNFADEIRSILLGRCIERFVTSPEIRICAQRAAWLGNDETHYVRRWQDRDIEDLKLLIILTMNWIHNVLLTEHYASQMPAP